MFFMLNQVPIICFSISMCYSSFFFNERYDYNAKLSYRYFTVTVWWCGAFICFRYMQNVFCLYFSHVTDLRVILSFITVSGVQILAMAAILYYGFIRSDHLFKRLAFYLSPSSLDQSIRASIHARMEQTQFSLEEDLDEDFFRFETQLDVHLKDAHHDSISIELDELPQIPSDVVHPQTCADSQIPFE
eukprot:TRINITY_DN3362_c0_g1_i1.p1 TRINITY_DN3362_c0_g1~~TRINITY_DN3362_c0_g1_i1.p1  ORF type:complete len:188 (+),score=13.73 TRINITY_DN3362_c0_g1_i1:154-717(+)